MYFDVLNTNPALEFSYYLLFFSNLKKLAKKELKCGKIYEKKAET